MTFCPASLAHAVRLAARSTYTRPMPAGETGEAKASNS
jgi:hypothetical protein